MKNEQGQELNILADGHHTYEAAKVRLGLEVGSKSRTPEGLVGEELWKWRGWTGDYRYLDDNSTVW